MSYQQTLNAFPRTDIYNIKRRIFPKLPETNLRTIVWVSAMSMTDHSIRDFTEGFTVIAAAMLLRLFSKFAMIVLKFFELFCGELQNSSALSQWCLLVNESFSLYACSTHASRRRLRLNARRDDVTWRISSQTCSNLEELQLLRMWFCTNFFDHKITKPWIEWLRDKLLFF